VVGLAEGHDGSAVVTVPRPWARAGHGTGPTPAQAMELTPCTSRKWADPMHHLLNDAPHTIGSMSEPARELAVDEPKLLAEAVDDARLGVITHLTVRGERVAAIVPESMVDALRAAEDAEDAAEADAAMDEPGESIPLDELEAEFGH
jgi:antitoxin (DNA-binding transcriptional repressor) of toxin-antitoxin stability system